MVYVLKMDVIVQIVGQEHHAIFILKRTVIILKENL